MIMTRTITKGPRTMANRNTYLLLVGATGFWGANFVVGKLAVGVLPPLTVGAWRFLVAALCMGVLLWVRERPTWRSLRPQLPLYALLGAVGIFGFNALLFTGLKGTSPVNASLVMATNPLVTALLSAVLLRERPRLTQAAGALVSLVGVGLVLTGGSLLALHAISGGDLLVFGGNACWALYSVAGRLYGRGASPLALSACSMIAGAVCFLPFAPIRHLPASPQLALGTVAAILFMAICGSVLAYLWWVQGVARLGAGPAAQFFNLVPVWTLMLTAAGGGRLTLAQLGGALLVLAGVSLAARRPRARVPLTRAMGRAA
jgi:drug/metabolite transporter (DMT)-like permease